MEMVKLFVDVPLPRIEATRRYELNYQNLTGTITETITPTYPFNAMQSVVVSYNKKDIQPLIYAQSTNNSGTQNGVYFDRIAFTPPSNDNSTTGAQNIMAIGIVPNYGLFALNNIICKMRIQHITITSNGDYYPYNNNTVIKKIVVDVPTVNNTTENITNNGTYTPASPYTGYSSVTVNVPSNVNNTTQTITTNGTYTPASPYTGFSSVTVNVNNKRYARYISINYIDNYSTTLYRVGYRLSDIYNQGIQVTIPSIYSGNGTVDEYYLYSVTSSEYRIDYFYVAKLNSYKYLIGCGISNNGSIAFPEFEGLQYNVRYISNSHGSHNNDTSKYCMYLSAFLHESSSIPYPFTKNVLNTSRYVLIQFPKGDLECRYLILDSSDFNYEF